MIRNIILGLLIVICMTATGEAANLSGKTQLQDMRYSLGSGTVRIVLDLKNRVDFSESYAENPSRLIVSLKDTWIDVKSMKRDIELNSTAAKRIKVAQFDSSTVRIVVETMADVKIFWLNGGPSGQRLVIDIGNAEFVANPELNNKQNENPPPEVNTPEPDTEPEPERILPPSKLGTDKKDDKKADKKSDKKDDKKKSDDKKKPDKTDDKKSGGEVNEPFTEIDDDINEMMALEGKTIAIDPGHGGADAGAIGSTGVTEKSVTLRVALELRELLENEGAKVIMTRVADKPVSSKGDKASAIEELQARCDVANKAKADIFISIHADSFTNPNARGTTGYYFTGSTKSKKLADAIRKAICEQLRTPSRGTKSCNFYVVRHTSMPATLIELAFISNKEEEELLDSDEGITKAAQGILDGIEDYFG